MSVIIDGTNGISDVDGSAATPAIRGTDANTGIFFPAADTIAFSEGGAESMRLDSTGDVNLYNAKSFKVYNPANTRFGSFYTDDGGTRISSWNGSGEPLLLNAPTGYFTVSTNGSERMRITSAGYLKASNDGTYTNATGAFHELRTGAQTTEIVVMQATNASYTGDACFVRVDRNTTNNSFYAFSYYNGGATAYRFRVADSGNVTNTNGTYGTISDIKNKENIVDATPKLEKIKQLQVRNFNFKGDDLKQIGFVAQEFEQVFPSMVEEHLDKDAEGNDLGTTTKSIKTSVLVPILVKAIQELNAKVEAQAAEIAALKNPPQPVIE
jgi:hypothetical protein